MQDASSSVNQVGDTSKSTQRDVDRSSSRMSSAMGKVATAAKLSAAAAAAAGAAYLANLVRKGIQAADQQGELAQQLGVTNQELAVLQRAAELAGLSSTELTSNMERLNRRLGQAADGSGQAADALERIGLSVEELEGMSPEEQMQTLGDALSGVESQSQKAAIASDLFGRSGQRMMLLLDGASETFDRARDEVERFGLALDESQTDAIGDINTDLDTMGAAVKGASLQLASAFSPALRTAADIVVRLSGAIGRWSERMAAASEAAREMEVVQAILEDIDDAAQGPSLEELSEAFATLRERERELASEISDTEERLAQQQQDRVGIMGNVADATEGVAERQRRELAEVRSQINEVSQAYLEAMESAEDAGDAGSEGGEEASRSWDEIARAARGAREEAFEAIEGQAGLADAMGREFDTASEKMAFLEGQIEQLINISTEEFNFGLAEILESESGTITSLIELYNELNQSIAPDDGFAERLQAVTDSTQTETEIMRQQRDERLAILEDERAQEILTEEEIAEQKRRIEDEFTSFLRAEEEERRELAQERIDRAEMDLMSEQERRQAAFDARIEQLREAHDTLGMSEAQFRETQEALEDEHQKELTEIARRETQRRVQMISQSAGQIANNLISAYESIATAGEKSEKEQFEARKRAAMASAVVSTAQGAAMALANYPPPLSFVMAAAQVAAGAAQIANIRSQSFSGGGGNVSAGGAGGGGSPTVTQQGQQADTGTDRTLLVQGDLSRDELFSGDAVRDLIDRIGEAQRDGYRVVT